MKTWRPHQEKSEGFAGKDDKEIQSSTEALLSKIDVVIVLFDEFEASCSQNATFGYWKTYMKLVSIILRFTHSLRDGDWELFLSSFAEILPWFGAFDHYHYTLEEVHRESAAHSRRTETSH